MNPQNCGLFIQSMRKQKRLTQNELAELIGVTDKAISRWETGEGFPEVTILPKLAYVLGVTVDEILQGKRAHQPQSESVKIESRFKLMTLMSVVSMWFGFVFSIFIVNVTNHDSNAIWFGMIPLCIFIFAALIVYIIFRALFIEKSTWNSHDKLTVYKQTRLIYSTALLTVFLYAPYPIGHFMVLNQQGWMVGVISFDTYLLWALIALIIVAPLLVFISIINKMRYNNQKMQFTIYGILSILFIINTMIHFFIYGRKPDIFIMPVNLIVSIGLLIFYTMKQKINKLFWIAFPFILFGLYVSFLMNQNTEIDGYNQGNGLILIGVFAIILTLFTVFFAVKKNESLYQVFLIWVFMSWTFIVPYQVSYLAGIFGLLALAAMLIGNYFISNKQKALS